MSWQVTQIQTVGNTTIKTWENVPSLADIMAESRREEEKRKRKIDICPRCKSVLNVDGYCAACGYPFPPRA